MIRRRKRKRIAGVERIVKTPAMPPNQSWSMDFVPDDLVNGQRIRCLNIVDDFTKQCLAIEVDHSMPRLKVVRLLEWLAENADCRCYRTKQGAAKRAHRELQRQIQGRMPE